MQNSPIRILLAKVGLDGHDRGVRVLARAFRDAGMEVIYTGLWQTPAAAVKAAIEEDVDVLGVSFHSAAHRTLVPIIRQAMEKAGRLDIPLVLGGIIPQQDFAEMKAAGVSSVFEPESSLADVIAACRELGTKSQAARTAAHAANQQQNWKRDSEAGNTAALGRYLTYLELHDKTTTPPDRAGTLCVGVTGSPGVGKSTLIGQLLRELRKRIKSVGVIAVDPASPITGGALLGDRARMTASVEDTGVFIRSSASRGAMGGVADATSPMTNAMRRAGFEMLVVETVGAGQNDVAIRKFASPVVLVMMPGAGDDLQLDKAGITEIADVFVINKSDLAGADRLDAQIRQTLGADKPIVHTVASHGKGISELADVLLGMRKK